jgi:hypothetical protein
MPKTKTNKGRNKVFLVTLALACDCQEEQCDHNDETLLHRVKSPRAPDYATVLRAAKNKYPNREINGLEIKDISKLTILSLLYGAAQSGTAT